MAAGSVASSSPASRPVPMFPIRPARPTDRQQPRRRSWCGQKRLCRTLSLTLACTAAADLAVSLPCAASTARAGRQRRHKQQAAAKLMREEGQVGISSRRTVERRSSSASAVKCTNSTDQLTRDKVLQVSGVGAEQYLTDNTQGSYSKVCDEELGVTDDEATSATGTDATASSFLELKIEGSTKVDKVAVTVEDFQNLAYDTMRSLDARLVAYIAEYTADASTEMDSSLVEAQWPSTRPSQPCDQAPFRFMLDRSPSVLLKPPISVSSYFFDAQK